MQKIQHSIVINAPREKVWDVMLDDATYREWTNVFHPGSYYKGNWEDVGSKMQFIGPDPDGGPDMGMIAIVRECRKPEYVSVEHVGMIKGDEEDTTSEEVKKWTPAFENYTFTEVDGGTEVAIELDAAEEHVAMMEDMWPKALAKLKEIAEQG